MNNEEQAVKKEKTEFELLKEYMEENVNKGAHIDSWNQVRETAKATFSQETIGQLDASGFITKFKLYH